ncbi:DUF3135 domain-containing protein [Vibrio ziniensis]|uniref:DUF3135 domain-containing protein n=1 Tax=Vibrio ziniensis TaxID=2711221 RepID=A0A6G7CEZ2_9VIBR|nr:DUF3135 domain-containing protein [Vibrio ziniensis]QIH40640.1 DUF3135 domain-containing protein [Vibrio ziniensis]
MPQPQSQPYNQELPPFDELVALAKQNPEAFTKFKHQMCEEMISSASLNMQQRLRAQQSHIDLVVSQCKNPYHINVTLMREMTIQMVKFRDALEGDVEPQQQAVVIPFPHNNKEDWH